MKSIRANHDRVITCTIENGNEKIKQNFNSKSTVKEIKHQLKKNISDPTKQKMINLYYQGKPLDKDDISIGNLCNNDELDLVMVSITMTDSITKDQKKVNEKIINKLISTCNLHKGDKELNICVTCGVAFCDQCAGGHKGHKTVSRSEMTKFADELKETKENLNKNFTTLELTDSYSDSDICRKEREEVNMQCDSLAEMIDNIRKKTKSIYSDFKCDFDAIFPYLIEYKEKVEGLYEDTKKETTVRLEKKFIDFYCKYTNVRNHSEKINENLFSLKRKIENFKDILNDMKTKLQSITDKVNEQYLLIKDIKLFDDLYQDLTQNNLKVSNFHNSTNNINFFSSDGKGFDKRANSEIRSSHFSSNSFGRMNLITLLSPPKDKKALVKMIEHQYKERKMTEKSQQSNNNISMLKNSLLKYPNKIEEKNEDSQTEGDTNYNLFFNVEIKTSNLIMYNVDNKTISKIEADLSKTVIKKFEAYHSILNYKGKFYISGGYTTGKMFYKYNKTQNDFIKLADMPTKHAFHCLLGVGDSIMAISGYKTKKVERYAIDANKWTSLPELENSRSWSSCISIDDKFIFVFGGLIEVPDGKNKSRLVEKLDITNTSPDNKWETLEVKSDIDLSFYFGVLKIDKEKILLLGGKFDPKEDNIDKCFSYSFESNTVFEEAEFKLPNKDEFDGKIFIELGNKQFGQFSSIYPDMFYIVDIDSKSIEVIKSENNSNNIKQIETNK